MAHRHGKAGQYCKGKAINTLDWVVGGAIVVIGVFGFGLGIAVASVWRPQVSFLATGYILFLGVTTIVIHKWLVPYLDELFTQRVKYLKGGQTEGYVAHILEHLGKDWHIFNNIKLDRSYDIDHVVAGPWGVFSISTKSERGFFDKTGEQFLWNQKPCNHSQAAFKQAMSLKDRMQALLGADMPWIQPVLAVPFGYVHGDSCTGKVWVLHMDNLIDGLCPEEPAKANRKRLSKEQLQRTVKALEMLQKSAESIHEPQIVPTA